MPDRIRHRVITTAARLFLACCVRAPAWAQSTPATRPAAAATIDIFPDRPARPISPDLFGIFFEDLNYAADGGLYAELIQNRSFQYQPTEQRTWNAASFWELTARGGGKGTWAIDASLPVHANNSQYAVIEVGTVGEGVGLTNEGFDGIAVTAGATYDVSLFARQLFMNGRWGGAASAIKGPMPVVVRLERKDGTVLGEASLDVSGKAWQRVAGTIVAKESDPAARFVLLAKARGGIAVDEISVFPQKTFRDRPNGLRADLAQAIADLRPKFVRFPGGCLAHGDGLGNIYRWKDTIGPVEQRRGQSNLWGYHQSVGLGYFEYFQFCADIGATPLPVVAAGVSCQNSGHTGGTGQQAIAMADMPAYVQDVLDLVEYANGPATSTWGARRAAAGHPEPFGLRYLGIGNEDAITPEFNARFKMLYDAMKEKHPEITVIGTVGPAPAGPDFDNGWKLANELSVTIVDEHYYQPPAWFLNNVTRYDGYDRTKSKVYLGEYASHGNSLANALAEAAYMTTLERNGDVVHLASYAPLLCKLGHVQWHPDLIYFNNGEIFRTTNFYVQQLFGTNGGEAYVESNVTLTTPPTVGDTVAMSSVRDSGSGDVIVKLVNVAAAPLRATLRVSGKIGPEAICTVLSGDGRLSNPGDPRGRGNVAKTAMTPVTSTIKTSPMFDYDAPANSLTVLRFKTR